MKNNLLNPGIWRLSAATALASLCALPLATGAARAAAPPFGVSIVLNAPQRVIPSGAKLPVRIRLVNRGSLPLSLLQPYFSTYTFRFRGYRIRTHAACGTTAYSRWAKGSNSGPMGSNRFNFPICKRGHSMIYRNVGAGPFAARFVDISRPGSYRIRVETKYGPEVVPKLNTLAHSGPNWLKIESFGPAVLIPQDPIFIRPEGSPRKHASSKGRLRSNWVKIRIMPPYGGQRPTAITPAGARAPRVAANAKPGLHILLADPDAKGPGPVTVRAFLECNGRRPMALRLAGNPQLDFRAVQATGPSITGEYVVAKLPKPHEVPYIRKVPPPLTAYGRWLLKYPPKKMPEKSYKLKPGVVYKYAVPINLSCQYDMSQYGTYRVRVELAHPKIWSHWVNIRVHW